MKNSKIILDLCGGTGSWNRPYLEAGYRVVQIDTEDVRLEPKAELLQKDVRLVEFEELPGPVHGILAAPPCTMFSLARNRYDKTHPRDFPGALSVVDACLRIIQVTRPAWWALENPQGLLARWLGQPRMRFDPWEYGDPWTKRTCLWGKFNPPGKWTPAKMTLEPVRASKENFRAKTYMTKTGFPSGAARLSSKDAVRRAITPPHFAKAFFEANP